jgi:hypothetical protein
MSKEAMQLALEALESDPISHAGLVSIKQAITALRQALETEQEPVAHIDHRIHGWPDCFVIRADPPHTSPLYLSLPKREWVGLKDEEIDILSCETVKGNKSVNWLCKVLEAKLKEKNKW